MTDRRRRAGDRLRDAFLALQPTWYVPGDDAAGPLADVAGSPGLVTLATSADADDIVDTATPHGMVAGDPITFATLTGGSGVAVDTPYFVIATSLAAQTFKFSLTAGGAAVSFGSDITAGTVRTPWKRRPATVTGAPTFGIAAPDPIGRAIAWSGTGMYATTPVSVPTPAASITVMALYRSASDASVRTILARGAADQYSWNLRKLNTHELRVLMYQSNAGGHATLDILAVGDDDVWRLVVATFDGTTLRGYCSPGNLAGVSTTTLAGSWHKASTAAIGVGHLATGNPFAGSLAHVAYWNDRVLTHADFRYLASIVHGG